jgi:nucleotide-binding universal stress UspA family protein
MTEITWQKILCPVDYSERSRAALRVAVDLARRFGAALTLLHVEEAQHAGESAKLDAWRSEALAQGLRVETAVVNGDPQTAIAQWATDHGVDAIVMGTHGRTGRAHALVGSVAETTVRRARCPVMVVHHDWARLR